MTYFDCTEKKKDDYFDISGTKILVLSIGGENYRQYSIAITSDTDINKVLP